MNLRELGRALLGAGALAGTAAFSQGAEKKSPARPTFRDLGWVWEGQGIDPKVPPSIYGLGQGARYSGLSRVNYLFHPNDVHAVRDFIAAQSAQ